MADEDKLGIQMIVEGMGKFLSDLNAANSAMAQSGTQAGKTAKQITDLGVRWNDATKRFQATTKIAGLPGLPFLTQQKALEIAAQNAIKILQRTGAEVERLGIKWDKGARKWVDASRPNRIKDGCPWPRHGEKLAALLPQRATGGKCHRKHTALRGAKAPRGARVKWRGKSSPPRRRRRGQGKPHPEQGQTSPDLGWPVPGGGSAAGSREQSRD